MRKSAADRFRHLFNRSLILLRHRHRHHHHPFPSSSSLSPFSRSRFFSSTPFSMASDSPFPVTAQNINPKVWVAFNSLFRPTQFVVFRFLLLVVLKLQALEFLIAFFFLSGHVWCRVDVYGFALVSSYFSLCMMCNVFIWQRIDLWLNYCFVLVCKDC